MRLVPLVLGALALAGCGPRGQLTVDPDAGSVGSVQSILVATDRGEGGDANVFDGRRSDALTFARFAVSVPPDRRPGIVTFPDAAAPDPRVDFLTVSASDLGGAEGLVARIDASLAVLPPEEREVFVFVHGFNTNFSEGLYRHAQMRHDFQTPGVSVHYSWPSAASVRSYGYDRESAIFSRDGLAATLRAVDRSRAERIVVSAHSMGAMLLMETLRSLALTGAATGFFDKLQSIALIAPDLDVDVFRGQIAPLAPYDTPVYVFFSSRDRALRLSAFLRGDADRLGSIRDLARVRDLPVTLIDTSDVTDGQDALGHFAVATSPTMIAVVQGMTRVGPTIFADAANQPGPVGATFEVIQNVGETVLSPLAQ